MRIERINENSISCTLTSFDLSVRNLNLRELAYGSEKAKKLFQEMMNKASTEVGFNAENTPIMIEAIPLSSDSIKLIISKVTDPEELDTRFSRFTQNPNVAAGKDGDSWINRLTSILLEGSDAFAEQLKKLKQSADDASSADDARSAEAQASDAQKDSGDAASVKSPAADSNDYRAFAFADLDMVISASRAAASFAGSNMLYKSPIDGRYLLVVRCMGTTPEDFSKACNVIAEYGRMIKTVQNTLSYYDEHYKVIIADGAIGKLAGI